MAPSPPPQYEAISYESVLYHARRDHTLRIPQYTFCLWEARVLLNHRKEGMGPPPTTNRTRATPHHKERGMGHPQRHYTKLYDIRVRHTIRYYTVLYRLA